MDAVYNGPFLDNVQLLAEFVPVMQELLSKPEGTIKYLIPVI